MNDDVIPTSYEQRRHCIEVRGNIRLTLTYIDERLAELQDGGHAHTREFEELYGTDHLQRTIAWFRRAAGELSGEPQSRHHA